MIIVGVDPGKATGVAVLRAVRVPDGSGTLTRVGIPASWSVTSEGLWTLQIGEFLDGFTSVLHRYPDEDMIVSVEKFVATRTTLIGQAMQSVEVTGMVQGVLHCVGRSTNLIIQSPGDAKSIMTNAKLREVGLLPKGVSDHAADALRHAALCALRTIVA